MLPVSAPRPVTCSLRHQRSQRLRKCIPGGDGNGRCRRRAAAFAGQKTILIARPSDTGPADSHYRAVKQRGIRPPGTIGRIGPEGFTVLIGRGKAWRGVGYRIARCCRAPAATSLRAKAADVKEARPSLDAATT